MTPEEYQRIKEAEKEHLRKLRELKRKVRELERLKKVNQALSDVTGGAASVLDTHREMIEKLAMETALSEARLELALEAEQEAAPASAEDPASNETLEEALQKARAQELIRQMKLEVTSSADETPARPPAGKTIGAMDPGTGQRAPGAETTTPPAAPEKPADPPAGPDPLPDKTIGRMKP
ncbi:hypothetical protein GQ464_008485 [Rhodocaloribacter litoris]|uniref:hypothetical protein n=1 Tax=Rhodocaloribacter litoris TaxID=2558931 RepID=UPI001423D2BF|nr:hypothetical protein [Rhodocaloribacter litoris]QXD16956.1 hypothetical protein GQ464_008485 [Rhodocaloribacter litoris]